MLLQQEVWIFATDLLVLWLFVYLLARIIPLEKYGLKVSMFFIKYESQRFKAFLYKTSEKRRQFWKVFSNLSIALGAGLMIFAIYFLSDNLLKFVQPGGTGSPVVPVLPGVTLRLYWLPYFMLALVLAVVTHEVAHGIVARVEGVNIKSAAVFFALIFLGGLVELEDKDLEKASTTTKLRIISSGSSLNLSSGLLVFLVLLALFVRAPMGLVVIEVSEDGPLELAGFQRWDILYAINGTPVRTFHDLGVFMTNVTPGERLILSTNRGNVSITAASDPDEPGRAIIGLLRSMSYYPSRIGLGFFWDVQLYLTLNWMFILLVNLAIFSMLPICILDGDKFAQYFLQRFTKRDKEMKTFLNAASLFLIIANVVLSTGRGLSPF